MFDIFWKDGSSLNLSLLGKKLKRSKYSAIPADAPAPPRDQRIPRRSSRAKSQSHSPRESQWPRQWDPTGVLTCRPQRPLSTGRHPLPHKQIPFGDCPGRSGEIFEGPCGMGLRARKEGDSSAAAVTVPGPVRKEEDAYVWRFFCRLAKFIFKLRRYSSRSKLKSQAIIHKV